MPKKNNNSAATTGTPQKDLPGSRFERLFYRYLAWFPILVLPLLVVELLGSGDYAAGGIIGVMHAVLVFRFVQVVNIQALFRRKAPGA
ncbi:MAG: hypothetical protein KYX62_10885 [Pseudomonadota bacterium]|nr:hypothetical protein [Pseudomonadota bacterium]